jgi:hypothetical protein
VPPMPDADHLIRLKEWRLQFLARRTPLVLQTDSPNRPRTMKIRRSAPFWRPALRGWADVPPSGGVIDSRPQTL